MTLKPFLLHPAAVHFPIALLAAGAAAAGARLIKDSPVWLSEFESWLLLCGTLSAWGTLALGYLAEKTAPHVPSAWEVLADHQSLALWTCSTFTLLSVLRFYSVLKNRDAGYWRVAQLVLWAFGLFLLISTAQHGGELVFKFGMGVVSQ